MEILLFMLVITLVLAKSRGSLHFQWTLNAAWPALQFSNCWEYLGPFRIGTREAIWGADILEGYVPGGFHQLHYASADRFSSPLARNGTVGWQVLKRPAGPQQYDVDQVDLTFKFPSLDWPLLQSVYGWAALQYQGWARGTLLNNLSVNQTVLLHTEHLLELWVNDEHFFGGDFYGFDRAPLVISLSPGENKLDLRLVRDVRAMGASDSTITLRLRAHPALTILHLVREGIVVSDTIEGRLASSLARVTVCNTGQEWLSVIGCTAVKGLKSVELLKDLTLRLAPHQCRPASVVLQLIEGDREIVFSLQYTSESIAAVSCPNSLSVSWTLKHRAVDEPHKVTFLHPSGTVSYAIIKPPPYQNTTSCNMRDVPVLINLHGAGLEADSHQVRHMLDSAREINAWIVFPTGMSPWSGDDWHTWGHADVTAAVGAIEDWISTTQWSGPGALLNQRLVSGHSNGGQGTWFIASHEPDVVIGAAVASGYTSIQNYVPFVLWNEIEPSQRMILENALTSYRHELLIPNMATIPKIIQHGELDDNVPAYHGRLMASMFAALGSATTTYHELPGVGHWFDGAMTTSPLQEFYAERLISHGGDRTIPSNFTIVSPNSDDMKSVWGIQVDQLESPDLLGRIDVTSTVSGTNIAWRISTINIRRFHLTEGVPFFSLPDDIFLDHDPQAFPAASGSDLRTFVRRSHGGWVTENSSAWKSLQQRYGEQRGALDAILRTKGAFRLVPYSPNTLDVATEAGRNFLQYFGADAELSESSYGEDRSDSGNVIIFAIGALVPPSLLVDFPIRIHEHCIQVHYGSEHETRSFDFKDGLGAIFLRPLLNARLELVVWGSDKTGLRQAARLIPTLTGAGQPDFVIVSNKCRWQGVGGVLAMGFFDSSWQISKASSIK